ncbi:MAG: hypothetical protein IOD12_05945 [Silvanigrellales bacterium]|jgi:hypothetical protein|nr:hypothetical protein [Silvanigrellales bacterium]
MSKQKKFADLNAADAAKKHSELAKELVKFRLSLDPSSITSAAGVASLLRDMKVLARKAAVGLKAAAATK